MNAYSKRGFAVCLGFSGPGFRDFVRLISALVPRRAVRATRTGLSGGAISLHEAGPRLAPIAQRRLLTRPALTRPFGLSESGRSLRVPGASPSAGQESAGGAQRTCVELSWLVGSPVGTPNPSERPPTSRSWSTGDRQPPRQPRPSSLCPAGSRRSTSSNGACQSPFGS